jgi:hypothetical protein
MHGGVELAINRQSVDAENQLPTGPTVPRIDTYLATAVIVWRMYSMMEPADVLRNLPCFTGSACSDRGGVIPFIVHSRKRAKLNCGTTSNVINFKGERCGGWRRIRQMAPARTSPPAGAISSISCAAHEFCCIFADISRVMAEPSPASPQNAFRLLCVVRAATTRLQLKGGVAVRHLMPYAIETQDAKSDDRAQASIIRPLSNTTRSWRLPGPRNVTWPGALSRPACEE